jgi:hypothetical protein
MPRCDNNVAVYSWLICGCLCGCEEMRVCELVPPPILAYRLRFSSDSDATDPTSALCDVHLRESVVCVSRIYHHVPRIRYETPLVLRLGDIHSDRPTDFLAFSVIVYLVVRSNLNKIPIPSLFKIIVRDATRYFLVIFTSHLVLVIFLGVGNVRISSQSSIFFLRSA